MIFVLERIVDRTDYRKASVRNGWCFLYASDLEKSIHGGFLQDGGGFSCIR